MFHLSISGIRHEPIAIDLLHIQEAPEVLDYIQAFSHGLLIKLFPKPLSLQAGKVEAQEFKRAELSLTSFVILALISQRNVCEFELADHQIKSFHGN
ncbi:uncharacterized protein PADG_01338 [Paracoccidioides brasiliensis Pb18]|uniref:Uncharacterized protein n=1 Tax=Paracoccidioides brasiliensis (strain Pb18) TaxID=502780 RepID=C1G322_PARBD|nr:uncharacterized protein PADG_01338 [Paracoccidioides brasiliensis Pb18]EEH45188.2 hypothetical protein PADG_01338 [Paracoccidioides brasiliensis Pb18]